MVKRYIVKLIENQVLYILSCCKKDFPLLRRCSKNGIGLCLAPYERVNVVENLERKLEKEAKSEFRIELFFALPWLWRWQQGRKR